jgi:CRP-like cAMP-binding protein
MLAVEAVAGAEGALISFMRADAAREWIESSPVTILENIGSRLASIEAEYYRSSFQLADSRIAALLLELAGENSVIEEVSHEKLGERLGLYRETVTVVLDAMKLDKLIEVGRMRIAILDKRALRELSEL